MKLTMKELVVFGMLGGVMFISKLVMDALPNIHLLALLTVVFTLVFRAKALYPIYVYVTLLGVLYGFAPWWFAHLYVWALLWGAVMLLPKEMNKTAKWFVCIGLCAAHGLLYGALCAPVQAVAYGMGWQAMLAWIVAGLPFDLIHGVGNFCLGFLIRPLTRALYTAKKYL